MRSWNACLTCLTRWRDIIFMLTMVLGGLSAEAWAQSDFLLENGYVTAAQPADWRLPPPTPVSLEYVYTTSRDTVPEPRTVMRRSALIPGWGQVTNKQTWKVPLVYGVMAGAVVWTMYNDRLYQGYRAAYYNSFATNTDLRFGPTPAFIVANQPPDIYRFNRNQFRNQRDLGVLYVVLAYGLNVADAYIFAQLRDFDVSDDLSSLWHVSYKPIAGHSKPTITLTIRF